MYNYDPKSLKAEEFINHEEIEETLRYAEENKHNAELIDSILEKQSSEKDFRTERQRFCSTATFPKRTRKYTSSQSRSRRTFTATES